MRSTSTTDSSPTGCQATCWPPWREDLVRIKAQHYGKGPTEAKVYQCDDWLFCVLRGGLTPVERTLLEHGDEGLVRRVRLRFQELMTDRFIDTVARAAGRRVLTYQSQIMFDPDVAVETFLLGEALPGRCQRRPSARRRSRSAPGPAATAGPRGVGLRAGAAAGLLARAADGLAAVFLGGVGELVEVLLAALLHGLGGLASDLLAVLHRLLPGLLDLSLHLVGNRPHALVLDARRGQEQTNDESHADAGERDAERVVAREASDTLRRGRLVARPVASASLPPVRRETTASAAPPTAWARHWPCP